MSADIDCLKNTCECANHDGLLYRRIGERLEKELATAKAENARLASAIKGLQWPTKGWDSKVSLAKAESDAEQALSSSNALDYWKGEIRKAQLEVWEEVDRQRSKLIPQAFKVFLDTRIAEYRQDFCEKRKP